MTATVAALLGFGLMLMVSVMAGSKTARQVPTLLSYFWANRSLKAPTVAQLLLSTSFSLNGLLYHTWLGYAVGVWSILIQFIWCVGFIFLAVNSDKIATLVSRDNLHGSIGRTFTPAAASLAALATIVGFASLAGWEFVIAGGLINAILDVPPSQAIWAALLTAVVVAAYTIRGGLRGNARANTVQNLVAMAGLIALAWFLFNRTPDAVDAGATNFRSAARWFENPLLVLGGIAFFANAYFSLVWQTADATNWQAMSSASGSPKDLRRTLYLSSALIIIAPGVIGTAVGMALHGMPDITSDNIISQAVLAGDLPIWAIVLVAAGLCGAMLSTLDGLLLACANAVSWDLFKPSASREILKKEKNNEQLSDKEAHDEAQILSVSYMTIFAISIVSSLVVLLLNSSLPLFNIVYFAVIGQMAIVPCAIVMVFKAGNPSLGHGAASIGLGLVGGFSLFAASLLLAGTRPDLAAGIGTFVPIATSAFATIPLLIKRRA